MSTNISKGCRVTGWALRRKEPPPPPILGSGNTKKHVLDSELDGYWWVFAL